MRLIIADSDFAYRARLRPALKRVPGLDVVAELDGFEALTEVGSRAASGDLVLLAHDLAGLPRTGTQAVVRAMPSLPVVVVGPNDPDLLREMFRQGARGYLREGDEMKELGVALRVVADGGIYLPPLLNLKPSEEQIQTAAGPVPAGFFRDGGENYLTPRQWEVLGMIRSDWDNTEIADTLKVTVGTVKIHITAIFKALGVRNRTGAKMAAVRLGVPELKRPGS